MFNNLYLEATNSADEDPRLEAWSIDNESYTKQASGWVIRPRVIKLAVLGSPQWVTNEADGPDLPGAGHNAHQTNGVVTLGNRQHGPSDTPAWTMTTATAATTGGSKPNAATATASR